MNNLIELKPCPFCGGKAMLTEIYREMADAQKKALEEICNRWEGGNEEWTISTM